MRFETAGISVPKSAKRFSPPHRIPATQSAPARQPGPCPANQGPAASIRNPSLRPAASPPGIRLIVRPFPRIRPDGSGTQIAPRGRNSSYHEQLFLTDRKFETGRPLLVAAVDHRHRALRGRRADFRLPCPELPGHVARLRMADADFGHPGGRALLGQQTLHHGPRLDGSSRSSSASS